VTLISNQLKILFPPHIKVGGAGEEKGHYLWVSRNVQTCFYGLDVHPFYICIKLSEKFLVYLEGTYFHEYLSLFKKSQNRWDLYGHSLSEGVKLCLFHRSKIACSLKE
jgi:hypothetical protein